MLTLVLGVVRKERETKNLSHPLNRYFALPPVGIIVRKVNSAQGTTLKIRCYLV